MIFKQAGHTSGDETTPYTVSDWKSRTVGEFIQEVLKENPKEWGYISVGHWYRGSEMFKGECEYRYGKIVHEMPKGLLDVESKNVIASGGWSRMDYVINGR